MLKGLAAMTVAVCGVLAGCGGGGAEDAGAPLICPSCPPRPAAGDGIPGSVEGYWLGTSGPYEFGAVVLPDGMTYVAYTRAGILEGFMVGKTSASSAEFAGSVVDFNAPLRVATATTLVGNYTRQAAMVATAQIGNTTRTFSSAYDPTYDTAVDLAGLAGTWTGSGGSKDGFTSGSLQLATDGTYAGSTPVCSFTGALSAITAGKHPLRTVATFAGASCPLAGKTITGVAVVSEVSGRRQILTTGIADDQSDGFFALLNRR